MDLLGGTDSPVNIMSPSMNPPDKQYSSNNTQNNAMPNNQDLLDLLGGLDMNVSTPLSPTIGNNIIGNSLLDDLTANNPINNSTITALDKNGLNVTLVPNKIAGDGTNSGCVRVVMIATNNSLNTLEQYLVQAAVQKSFALQMLSATGSVLAPGGTITQEMRISSSTKVSPAKPSIPMLDFTDSLIILITEQFTNETPYFLCD